MVSLVEAIAKERAGCGTRFNLSGPCCQQSAIFQCILSFKENLSEFDFESVRAN